MFVRPQHLKLSIIISAIETECNDLSLSPSGMQPRCVRAQRKPHPEWHFFAFFFYILHLHVRTEFVYKHTFSWRPIKCDTVVLESVCIRMNVLPSPYSSDISAAYCVTEPGPVQTAQKVTDRQK